jgi:methylenetetrahydrofolate dehydrogenase (NADP+)/methenyltetrahydrofolate cyclohydrolase/formyltetrahydrofolate synthetase
MASNNSTVTLNGRSVASNLKKKLAIEFSELKSAHPDLQPKLVIIQVGDREDSNVYIRMKSKAAAEVGVSFQHLKLPSTTTESKLLSVIDDLNNDEMVHAILLQLP